MSTPATFASVTAGIPGNMLGVRSPMKFVQAAMWMRDYGASVFRANGLQYSNDDLEKATNDFAELRVWHDAFNDLDYLVRCDHGPLRCVKGTAEGFRELEALLGRRIDTVTIESESGKTQFRIFKADPRDPVFRFNVNIADTGCRLATAFPCCGVIDRRTRAPFEYCKFCAPTETPLRRLYDLTSLLPKVGSYVPQLPRPGAERETYGGPKKTIMRINGPVNRQWNKRHKCSTKRTPKP